MADEFDLGFDVLDEEEVIETPLATKTEKPKREAPKSEEIEEEDEETFEEESDEVDEDDPLRIIQKDVLAPIGIIDEEASWETEDEFRELIQKKFVKEVEEKADARITSIAEREPDFKELYEYLKTGGTIQTFVDTKYGADDFLYTPEEISENEELQKYIVGQYLSVKGEVSTQEELQAELEEMESLGVLEKKASKFVSTLKKMREEEKTQLIENQKAAHNKRLKDIQDENNFIIKALDTKAEIAGLKIPKKDREALKDYLFKVDKEGKTPRQRKLEQIRSTKDVEKKLIALYAEMKDYNLTETARTAEAKSLREKLASSKSGGMTFKSSKSKGSKADIPEEYE